MNLFLNFTEKIIEISDIPNEIKFLDKKYKSNFECEFLLDTGATITIISGKKLKTEMELNKINTSLIIRDKNYNFQTYKNKNEKINKCIDINLSICSEILNMNLPFDEEEEDYHVLGNDILGSYNVMISKNNGVLIPFLF